MKQCSKGHIFDESFYSSCPYCSSESNTGTRPLDIPAMDTDPDFPHTMPVGMEVDPSFGQGNMQPKMNKNMGATVALNVTDSGVNPVRGWLVAVNGNKCGCSFVVHSEKNYIGRGSQFDIDLSFDKAVSKDGDAVISFDSRSSKFYLTPGASKNNIYLNGEILLVPAEVMDYDTVEIGSTKLVFRSFCNEHYNY